MKLQWPKGKYNGRRIGGFWVKLKINVLAWNWRPRYYWNGGEPGLHWLCFYSWWGWTFE